MFGCVARLAMSVLAVGAVVALFLWSRGQELKPAVREGLNTGIAVTGAGCAGTAIMVFIFSAVLFRILSRR